MSNKPRPLLLNTFACASAGMIFAGTNAIHKRSKLGTAMVRGTEQIFTVFDPRPCPMAPDFSNAGYISPFIKKDGEEKKMEREHQPEKKTKKSNKQKKKKRDSKAKKGKRIKVAPDTEDLSYILYGGTPSREE